MEACPESGGRVGMIVGKLNSGVEIGSLGAGEESEEGVNACSVPSRSGTGVETGPKSPHAKIKRSVAIIHKSFLRLMICCIFTYH